MPHTLSTCRLRLRDLRLRCGRPRVLAVLLASALVLWISSESTNNGKTTTGTTSALRSPHLIDGASVEQFVTPLVLLPVLYIGGKVSGAGYKPLDIAVRQFEQQILPAGQYPATTVWGYGDPFRPDTFHHPGFTVENVRGRETKIKWSNELVENAALCRFSRFEDKLACRPLKHIVRDVNGVSIVDQTLHWANPTKDCADGSTRTDCKGTSEEEYDGPIPMLMHLHGSTGDAQSDGYPEAWYLPNYKFDGKDAYAREGAKYGSFDSDYSGHDGYAQFNYANDQVTTALWYHDHTLGMTRLNVYAAAAGFWFIRTKDGSESGLKSGHLPGPPPREDDMFDELNTEGHHVRESIREIPLIITPKSFYKDGKLFYPANRAYFEGLSDGTVFADNGGLASCKREGDGEGGGGESLPPAWNPEAFFDVMVVNGKSWPYLNVQRERYRFRILNGADSRYLNLAFAYYCSGVNLGKEPDGELPMYVIGTEQGLRPNGPGKIISNEDGAALLVTPGERADIIVDFNELPDARKCPKPEVMIINTGPDEPFGGDLDTAWRERPMGRVMKFVVSVQEGSDDSSDSKDLRFDSNPGGEAQPECPSDGGCVQRHFALIEETVFVSATGDEKDCFNSPVAAKLGWFGPNNDFASGSIPLRWSDPIVTKPEVGVTEEWHFWNESEDGHPIHIHRGNMQMISRHAFKEGEPGKAVGPPLHISASEIGWKDMVVAYPGQVTKIRIQFTLPGLSVWHCHVLSHEDNEMMLPFMIEGDDF